MEAMARGRPLGSEKDRLACAWLWRRCDRKRGRSTPTLPRPCAISTRPAPRACDIVAFPEASLTGYVEPARHPDALVTLDGPVVGAFLAATRSYDATVLAGIVEKHLDGLPPYLTQLVARRGVLQGVYRKRNIVDDEDGWFTAGGASTVFERDGETFGIAICADIGLRAAFADAAALCAKVVFELAAPGLYGEQATRNWASGHAWWRGECDTYLSAYAQELGLWIPVATQAGRTVDEDFPGGGYLYDPTGALVAATDDWREGLLVADIPL